MYQKSEQFIIKSTNSWFERFRNVTVIGQFLIDLINHLLKIVEVSYIPDPKRRRMFIVIVGYTFLFE
eukprot:SAG11_NODE_132_length_15459_cov_61.061979_9_plen_66_part_01